MDAEVVEVVLRLERENPRWDMCIFEYRYTDLALTEIAFWAAPK